MDIGTLRERCIELFGVGSGGRLYWAMSHIAYNTGYCVATAMGPREVSIARSCEYMGRVFNLSNTHKSIYVPGVRRPVLVRTVGVDHLDEHLPEHTSDHDHCFVDAEREDIDPNDHGLITPDLVRRLR